MTYRVVLDTNVFISALLFEGEVSRLLTLWQKKAFHFLLTRSILDEYIRVLAYPKFQLTPKEIDTLIKEDLLPYTEIIQEKKVAVPKLKDRDDEKFLSAALSGPATHLVTGDRGLLGLERIGDCQIIPPVVFIKIF